MHLLFCICTYGVILLIALAYFLRRLFASYRIYQEIFQPGEREYNFNQQLLNRRLDQWPVSKISSKNIVPSWKKVMRSDCEWKTCIWMAISCLSEGLYHRIMPRTNSGTRSNG